MCNYKIVLSLIKNGLTEFIFLHLYFLNSQKGQVVRSIEPIIHVEASSNPFSYIYFFSYSFICVWREPGRAAVWDSCREEIDSRKELTEVVTKCYDIPNLKGEEY